MIKKGLIPTKFSKSRALLIIGIALVFYLLDRPEFFSGNLLGFFLKPIGWFCLTCLLWFFPRVKASGKLTTRSTLTWWAFNFAIIYVASTMLAGLIDGYGRSPYDFSIRGILINLLHLLILLFSREIVRAYLVNNLTKVENFTILGLVALFMTFINFPINRFAVLKDYKDIVIFTAQYFAPEFTKNLFASYLVFWGGPWPSIIYLGFLEVFHWFSPVLPNLRWITAALVGILGPAFSLMAMQNIYAKEAKLPKVRAQNNEGTLGWMVTILTSVGIIWFSVGVFPVYPSVIATGSMQPMIDPGDVILVQKNIKIEELTVGDIIQFRRDNILISHRITAILNSEEGTRFQTKGDNNTVADYQLVKPEQVKGRIVQVVPKVGWPTLLIKSDKEIPIDQVQF